MNDLMTDRQSDELSEADAALLFGGGPAVPETPLVDAAKAIRAAIPAAYAVSPKVMAYTLPWIRDVAKGLFTATEAANSITARIIEEEENDARRA